MRHPVRVILSVLSADESEAPRIPQLTRECFGINEPANLQPEGRADAAARQWAAVIEAFQRWHSSRVTC
jgi:hypothetical protein